MADQALIKKLGLKPKQRLCVLNAPAGYLDRLKPLPGGAELADTPEGDFDFVHLFVVNKAELERHFPTAVQALKPDGLLWISYPKGRAKVQTDLIRDEGWAAVTESGWQSVAMISIDEVWSAVRFRPGQPAAEHLQRVLVVPRPDLAREPERSGIVVVTHQQGTEVLAGALGRGVAADHELLLLHALDLEPVGRPAAHVG